jgi:single-stranded DNA-binding protein
MSLHILAVGRLLSDPAERTSKAGKTFATGLMRVSIGEGETVLCSIVAFNDQAEQLLAHHQDSTIAVAGPGKLSEWTGRDGAAKHGLSVIAEQIASAGAARRADAKRRSRSHNPPRG